MLLIICQAFAQPHNIGLRSSQKKEQRTELNAILCIKDIFDGNKDTRVARQLYVWKDISSRNFFFLVI